MGLAGWLEGIGSNVYCLLLYALLALIIYYLFPVKRRPAVLLAESFLFYWLCDAGFFILIAAETLFTWQIGRRISEMVKTEGRGSAAKRSLRILLAAGIGMILLVLCFFKYEHFFAETVGFSAATVMMPLGISYYSFREISYLADIYSGKRRAEESLLCYAAYVSFFPHMVSGPIARSEGFLERIREGLVWRPELASEGLYLVVSGLFKKVVIADRISPYVAAILAGYQDYPSIALWLALFLNAVYIYCDFAGYSEIAIGITKLYGIPCESNFRRPYLSSDMKEFWHRWHISLSSWLRDYVYIPLGGSRAGKLRTKCNVMIVFLLCGIWHGNTVTYLIWGAYHGMMNVLTKRKRSRIGRMLGTALVFVYSMFGWLLFRSDTLRMTGGYLLHLFWGFELSYGAITASILPFTLDNTCAAYLLTILLMLVFLAFMEMEDEYCPERAARRRAMRSGAMVLCILLLGVVGSGSFLYANY